MLTGRWFVEHDQRFCVTRAPVFVDGPVKNLNTLTSAVVCPYRAERGRRPRREWTGNQT